MGEHKGWLIRPYDGDRWRVWVWQGKRYKTKTFARESEGKAWAREEAAKVTLGLAVAAKAEQGEGSPTRTTTLAKGYLLELQDLGRSDAHRTDVGHILSALGRSVPDLAQASAPAAIEAWLRAAKAPPRRPGGDTKPLAPARRNKYLYTVRGCCRWAIRRRHLVHDPTASIRFAQVVERIKPQFTTAELRALLACVGNRSWRWVLLMVYGGLRTDEAVRLRWGDIDWDGRVLSVVLASGARIKRGRERLVPLQDELAELLRPLRGSPEQTVASVSPANLRRDFMAILGEAGVPVAGRSPHSFRHTWAGMLTATGVPTALVGTYLGHSNAQTTMGYTQLATRYVEPVKDWRRGELRVVTGWAVQMPVRSAFRADA
jgi:integrase